MDPISIEILKVIGEYSFNGSKITPYKIMKILNFYQIFLYKSIKN
ncbi:hypothetical protein Pogu_0964 [Pyrobaculum oguniense TE7]|uniref:Uncharacterized protein n=1 Tax=Pyrobaculum oguniense (strain DSM 13380 / JCM 10595 / TE7) TaxID=698757 RepID=H6Q9T3_PYROT|nr:hypothetical protein Pogu_0964 [Pyrobaculum oguniense TE7]